MFFYMSSNNSANVAAPALLGSAAALGAAAFDAARSAMATAQISSPADNIPIISGVAIGIIGIGWSIYSAGPDRRVRTLTDEIATLQEQAKRKDNVIKEQDMAITAGLDERNRLKAEIGELRGQLSNALARLTSHDARPPDVAPAPA
jgi:hypothetical protein